MPNFLPKNNNTLSYRQINTLRNGIFLGDGIMDVKFVNNANISSSLTYILQKA
jgi:hypothetical protein